MPSPMRIEKTLKLAAPPDEVWKLVADTDRMNRAAGMPSVEYAFERVDNRASRIWAKMTLFGIPSEWEEMPYEWTRPHAYSVERVFKGGPMERYRFGIRMAPDGTGTVAVIGGDFTPRSPVYTPVVKVAAGEIVRRLASHIEQASGQRSAGSNAEGPSAPTDVDALARAVELVRARIPASARPALDLLAAHLSDAPDRDVLSMRPFAWADSRGMPRLSTLEVFLHATKAGLLDMEWALRCPHCRGRPAGVKSLSELPESGDCPACAKKFDLDFTEAIEARFSVAPRIRRAEAATYCLAGPMAMPFVRARLRLAAGEKRALAGPIAAGAYLVRGGDAETPLTIEAGDRAGSVTLGPTGTAVSVTAGERAVVEIENKTGHEIAAAVEEATWDDRAAPAAVVSMLPAFRDLFASDVLAHGRGVAVKRLALLFSDLTGSTAMYRRLGDAKAYALVREHFSVFEKALERHNGVLVKTIGDAVMAVFARTGDALAAAREAHAGMPEGVTVRIGVHAGPMLAVELNGRNDFFGSTVNLASRLEHLAAARETIASAEAADEVGLMGPTESVPLKGFETPIPIVRIPF